ncbi:MAG: hypothetical protein Q7J04_10115 [Microcella sp.]|nr:hypothetical protein [Microcella sp.]
MQHDDTTSPSPTIVTVPPARTRAVSIAVSIALVFSSVSVGFAVGRWTAPENPGGLGGIPGEVPEGGFPGGGFPGGEPPEGFEVPEGGFPAPGGGAP